MNFKKLSATVFVVITCLACSSNKDQQADASVSDSVRVEAVDSTQAQADTLISKEPERNLFAGEYLVGDGNLYIVPVDDSYEIQDGNGGTIDVFYFQGIESDTVKIYSNKNKSITFKMNPDHGAGMYYTADEQLPVELVGPLPE